MKNLIWLSDLHLNEVKVEKRQQFYERLSDADGEIVVITGDISDASRLCKHLLELAAACGNRLIYFVLGNHDFYGSSFSRVHAEVECLCKNNKTLRHLGQGEIIPLGDNQALVGHGGWADCRAGHGCNSRAKNPDFWGIDDFRGMRRDACFQKMRKLGQDSGRYFRKILPYALTCYRHVYVATHFPPFNQGAWWNGNLCSYDYQPHYTNMSLGYALWGISVAFPKSQITVLAGHTHSEVSLSLRPNLNIEIAGAVPGRPWYQLRSVGEINIEEDSKA
jgi:predicted phosphohydrolase